MSRRAVREAPQQPIQEQFHQQTSSITEQDLRQWLGDPEWRLNNLYKIVDADNNVVTFKLNVAQRKLAREMHYRNVILKARKMGFSTFIQIYMLDACIFSSNQRGVVIAQNREIAEAIFRDVFKFAYNNLPEPVKLAFPIISESKTQIEFGNNSIVEVRTVARGGTPTILHVSEFGKISADDPIKAREIISGAITAVAKEGLIFIESTADGGEDGAFYKLVQTAIRLKDSGKKLYNLEPKFHFFPWFDDPKYVAPPGSTTISVKEHEYFDDLEKKLDIKLSQERRAWYVLTKYNTYSGDTELMYREMPSTPEEAFKVPLEGTYFAEQFSILRKGDRIGLCPYDPQYPVSAFYDIGANDSTAIWCIQVKPTHFSVINFIEAAGEPFIYFVRKLEEFGYVWDMHYLPHDANMRRQQGLMVTTAEEMLRDIAPGWNFYLVPRTPDKTIAIQQARNFLLQCVFDESRCKAGLKHLEAYRKEWNDRTGTWSNTPHHGPESNAADAFLAAAQAKGSGAFGSVVSAAAQNGFASELFGGYEPAPMGY